MNEQCEICNEKVKCDNHHIHSLSLGGPDVRYNKCRICPNCHRRVHMGDIILEGRYSTTNGPMLVWRRKGEESITGEPDPLVWLFKSSKKTSNKDYHLFHNYIESISDFSF